MRGRLCATAVALALLASPVHAHVPSGSANACALTPEGCDARQEVVGIRVAATSKQKNEDALLGAALGAIIAGAIVSSTDNRSHKSGKKHKGWWSPTEGVKCYDAEGACYKHSDYAAGWSKRVYGY